MSVEGTGKIGVLSATLMEELEESIAEGGTLEINTVAIVVECRSSFPEGHPDLPANHPAVTNGITSVLYRCNDDRGWVHHGLLTAALRASFE